MALNRLKLESPKGGTYLDLSATGCMWENRGKHVIDIWRGQCTYLHDRSNVHRPHSFNFLAPPPFLPHTNGNSSSGEVREMCWASAMLSYIGLHWCLAMVAQGTELRRGLF